MPSFDMVGCRLSPALTFFHTKHGIKVCFRIKPMLRDAAAPIHNHISNLLLLGVATWIVNLSLLTCYNEETHSRVVEGVDFRVEAFQTTSGQLLRRRRRLHGARNPLDSFQEQCDERIRNSEKVQGGFDHRGIRNHPELYSLDVWRKDQVIVSWQELKDMATDSEGKKAIDPVCGAKLLERRSSFAKRVASAGGVFFVKLDDYQSGILNSMWASMNDHFLPNHEDSNDDLFMAHQAIPRDGEKEEETGYDFVQTFQTSEGVAVPLAVPKNSSNFDNLRTQHAPRAWTEVFEIFSQVSITTCSVLLAPSLVRKGSDVTCLLDKMVHSETVNFAGCTQRLSRYTLSVDEDREPKESLKAHMDWSIVTVIPISGTPGLQLWQPNHHTKWLRHEELFKAPMVQDHVLGDGHDQCELNLDSRTRYLPILAGKWMELLSGGDIPACIHRVITTQASTPRLSAPFFFRPKEAIFATMRECAHKLESQEITVKPDVGLLRDSLLEKVSSDS